MPINNMNKIGEIIAMIRKAHGHSQTDLAVSIGVSRWSIDQIEKGSDFKVSNLFSILEVYKLEISKFFSDDLKDILFKMVTKSHQEYMDKVQKNIQDIVLPPT